MAGNWKLTAPRNPMVRWQRSSKYSWRHTYLQAPHSKVPLPSWHLSLLGCPSVAHSQSQMKFSTTSTSSVKPSGLILMTSDLPCDGHFLDSMEMKKSTWKVRRGFMGSIKPNEEDALKLIVQVSQAWLGLLACEVSRFLFIWSDFCWMCVFCRFPQPMRDTNVAKGQSC